ncbi:MAG: PadR family transcriptional regulator [Anaerolineae bacterium]|nr:PadR family transcriptional regulator [Anaerolineae bacterium]
MALKNMLLAMIEIQPRTGYELSKVCEHVLSNFWTADQRQVYHALDKMEGDGWISAEVIIQESAPNKKVYSITTQGMEALERWLTTWQPPQPVRREALAQIFFGGLVPPDALGDLMAGWRESLEARRTSLRGHLADYERILAHPPARDWGWLFSLRMMMFRYVVAQLNLERQWLEETGQLLDIIREHARDDMQPAQEMLRSLLEDFDEA